MHPTATPEDLREIRTDLEAIVSDGMEIWQRQEASARCRFNVWDGQANDGRKHAEALGEEAMPFEGASDTRIPAVDMVIADKKALVKLAFFRAQIQAQAIKPTSTAGAEQRSTLLRYLRDCELRDELEAEIELSAEHFFGDDPALSVVEISWHQDIGLVRRRLTLDELAMLYATGESDPARVAPDDPRLEPEMLGDFQDLVTNPLRAADFEAWLGTAFAGANPKALRRAARDLRREGAAELPVPVVRSNRPCVQALKYLDEVFFPPGTFDLQRARSIHRREWLNEVELRERIITRGWDRDWVEELIDKGRGFSLANDHLMQRDIVRADVLVSRPGGSVDETSHLYEVWWSYDRRADELGIPGIYVTTWAGAVRDRCAKCELFDSPDGGYPFRAVPRERVDRQITSSRGISRVLATHQNEIKTQRDARANYTQLIASPPMKTLVQRGAFEIILGPNAQIPVQRMDDFQPVVMPPFLAQSVEMERTTRSEIDEWAGRMTAGQDPNRVALRQQEEVNTFFALWRSVMRAVLAWARRYYTPEELEAIVGQGGATLQADSNSLDPDRDITIEIDSRDLNMEYAMNKLKAFAELRALDPSGILDLGPLVEWGAYSLDPVLARQAIRPQANVTQREISDEKNNLAQMASGIEPEMPEQGINAQLRLQTMQAHIQQSPRLAQLYQGDELFRALVDNRQKYLMQQLTQERNKTIGRLGTEPMQTMEA